MRCPYCREEIHDQAVKCPHCQRLLVPKPGWQRKRPAAAARGRRSGSATVGAVVTEEVDDGEIREPRTPRAAPKGRPPAPSRRAPLIFAIVVLMGVSALVGYVVGRTVTGAPIGFVSGDVERITAYQERLAQQAQEIQRLRVRVTRAEADASTPSEERLLAAVRSCNEAFTMVIEREAGLFGDQAALSSFVQLANRCLAPTGQEVEIPT